MPKKPKIVRFLGLGLAVLATQPDLWACEVCYGAADSPILDGMNASILFLLGITYLLIGGMVACFIYSRRKASQSARTRAGAR